MHARHLSLVLAAAALAAPPLSRAASAQSVEGPEAHGDPGYPGASGMRHGMRGQRRLTPPDPVVLNGPPAPDEFARIVELPTDKVGRYAQLYDRLMSSTRPQRDSLAAMRRDLRGAYEQGDREAAQQHRGEFRPLMADLERQQASFDEALQPLLAKGQWKRYQHWRDDQRKRAEEERKERRPPSAG